MKILIVGLGSIGQRHLRNIRQLYGNEVEIIAYRRRGLQKVLTADMKLVDDVSLEETYQIKSLTSLDDALAEKPDVAFITSITREHMASATAAAKAGCHLFIEKPLSDSLEGIEELKEAIRKNNLVVSMGFNLRYHPCLQELKRVIDSREYGSIISVNAVVGEHLVSVHEYEDYRTTYMAKKSMGGGLILTQLVHELDYLSWFFGDIQPLYSLTTKNSSLDIDVEDSCDALLRGAVYGENFAITLHGDFLQYPPRRYCEVVFEMGRIRADIIANELEMIHGGTTTLIAYEDYERNDSFMDEIKDFFGMIEGKTSTSAGLIDGASNIALALQIAAGDNGKHTLEDYERMTNV